MNEEQKYKIEQYDKHFKEMEETIEKVKQITKGETRFEYYSVIRWIRQAPVATFQ